MEKMKSARKYVGGRRRTWGIKKKIERKIILRKKSMWKKERRGQTQFLKVKDKRINDRRSRKKEMRWLLLEFSLQISFLNKKKWSFRIDNKRNLEGE